MDSCTAPAPAPAGLPRHAGRTLSGVGAMGLTAACTVLLFLYLAGRFLWVCSKETPAGSAGAPASPSVRAVVVVARPEAVPLSLLPVFEHAEDRGAPDYGCAVCLSEFGEREAGRLMPVCGHGFHEACIATWLRLNTTCPLCRASVASE